MLDHLDAKEDCFSLGILSALVANELNLSPGSKNRKKVNIFLTHQIFLNFNYLNKTTTTTDWK